VVTDYGGKFSLNTDMTGSSKMFILFCGDICYHNSEKSQY
jgi:hypothetical protein